MTYVIGAIAGLILGGAVGYLKNLFLWQRYLQESEKKTAEEEKVGGLYARALISYAVNILTLLLAFVVRNIVPFDEAAFLIGTAIALVVMNKILAAGQKKTMERRLDVNDRGVEFYRDIKWHDNKCGHYCTALCDFCYSRQEAADHTVGFSEFC